MWSQGMYNYLQIRGSEGQCCSYFNGIKHAITQIMCSPYSGYYIKTHTHHYTHITTEDARKICSAHKDTEKKNTHKHINKCSVQLDLYVSGCVCVCVCVCVC